MFEKFLGKKKSTEEETQAALDEKLAQLKEQEQEMGRAVNEAADDVRPYSDVDRKAEFAVDTAPQNLDESLQDPDLSAGITLMNAEKEKESAAVEVDEDGAADEQKVA